MSMCLWLMASIKTCDKARSSGLLSTCSDSASHQCNLYKTLGDDIRHSGAAALYQFSQMATAIRAHGF